MNRALACLAGLLWLAPALAQHEHHAAGDTGMEHEMHGTLGSYPMTRDGSGTSWQPDAAPMMPGIHEMRGFFWYMAHGWVDVVYDDQGGPRGDEKVFAPGMLMAMAGGPLGPGDGALRVMLSPDPLMGEAGYPLLFQTGETADGVTHLVDRQHPHDLFMELAGSYSVRLGKSGSVFAYGGLPGEPALGPAAFMHRASGVAIPEAPLSHHWLDSTHITFGVATLGVTLGGWKLEASGFNGREPDQDRWNIETRGFDSASGRVTFNPSENWSMQASYGYLAEPEQLEPGVAVHRTTASVSHSISEDGNHWSTLLAVGVNRREQHDQPAWLLESTQTCGKATWFQRAEYLRTSELIELGPLAGEEFGVGKLTVGGSYDVFEGGPLRLAAGVLGSVYRFGDELEPEYGAEPVSVMVFLRTSLR